jgi:tRNA(fMet)-specific endonuclease VapC
MNSILLVDTDVLSAVLRRHPLAFARANAYALQHSKLTFSAITRFEILRGLKAKSASRQLQEFEIFCAGNVILPVTDDVIDRASEIFADLYCRGKLIGDADIFIAATALVHGMGVVTNNVAHFSRVPGLHIEKWLVS